MRIHTPLFCWFAFSSLTEVELTRMVSFWGVQCDASIPTHILEWSAQSSYSACLSPHVVTIILFSLVGVAGKIYSLMNFRHTERCCLLQSACCASDPKTPSLRVCTKIALPQPSPSQGPPDQRPHLLVLKVTGPNRSCNTLRFMVIPGAVPALASVPSRWRRCSLWSWSLVILIFKVMVRGFSCPGTRSYLQVKIVSVVMAIGQDHLQGHT